MNDALPFLFNEIRRPDLTQQTHLKTYSPSRFLFAQQAYTVRY